MEHLIQNEYHTIEIEDADTTIHNSTIEWNEYATNLNFKDREIMEALDKCFFNGRTQDEIIKALESIQ